MRLILANRWAKLSAAIVVIAAIIFVIEALVTKNETPTATASTSNAASTPSNNSSGPRLAEFTGITTWLNSDPLTIQGLQGKVVLVDIWTYSCVNCIRTLPYLREWYAKYASRGFVIVGVHSPEFAFEKDVNNIRQALQKYGVTWPVAVDNDMATWQAYGNRYWPHKYLGDAKGVLRYERIGEGGYVATEEEIRKLLTEAGHDVSDIPLGTEAVENQNQTITREMYAGSNWSFGGYLGNAPTLLDGNGGVYKDPGAYEDGKIYYSGRWQQTDEFTRPVSPSPAAPASAIIKYKASSANVVIRPEPGVTFTLLVELDRKPVPKAIMGDDVTYDDQGRSVTKVDAPRMYNFVRAPGVETHELRLTVTEPGFQLYTYTFSIS